MRKLAKYEVVPTGLALMHAFAVALIVLPVASLLAVAVPFAGWVDDGPATIWMPDVVREIHRLWTRDLHFSWMRYDIYAQFAARRWAIVLAAALSGFACFIHKAEWDACGDVPADLDGRECFGGLDLGATRDLSAFVLAFPGEDRAFEVLSTAFMPEQGIEERSDEDRVPYALWAKQGHISLTPGATNDPAHIAEAIATAAGRFDIKAIAYDRWRIEDLRRELVALGCTVELVPFGQGFKDMAPAVDTLERAVAERRIRHGRNPVLNMCASNAVIERDAAGNRKLTKAKSTGRIDALVALTMALSLAERHEPTQFVPGCLAMLEKF